MVSDDLPEMDEGFQGDDAQESLASEDNWEEDDEVDPGADEFVNELYGAGDFPEDDEPDIAENDEDEGKPD